MAASDNNAESGFAMSQRTAIDATPNTVANTSAARGVMSPDTIGRPFVRSINWSMSRSTNMLKAFALPALMAPPTRVPRTSHRLGIPRSARNIAGAVVTKSSSITRGLVRAIYDRTVDRKDTRTTGGSSVVARGELTSTILRTRPEHPIPLN